MKKLFTPLIFLVFSITAFAQNYTILQDASALSGCNCFRLTPDANDKKGAIFQNQTINLNNSFDFTFNVFLGCNGQSGADGIVFVLTTNPNGLGSTGGALGYGGGSQPNSLAIEYDTWYNPSNNDPSQEYDHIGIESGGSVTHNVAAPVPALTNQGNIDDCNWHTTRIVWDVNTHTYSVYFDGVLRQSINIPNMLNYFGGNPIVNWGWSAGTGGGTNDQQVCVTNTSSWVAGVNYQSCNTTMQFSDVSTSSLGSVQSWAWNFGDGGTSSAQSPSHTYAAAGTYNVTLTITDMSGCTNTYTHPVTINPPITINPVITTPPCSGGTNGGINVSSTGGFGPSAGYGGYMYTWSNGPTWANNIGLGAGAYSVSVTDGVCSATAAYTLTQPQPLTATISHTDATCGSNNGTATATISGGTTPYPTITWYPSTVPGNPTSASGSAITGLAADTYLADIRDANGCSALLPYSATVAALPCGYTLSTSSTNVLCYGASTGSVTITVTGAVGPVVITWKNSANTTVGTTATVNGLPAGTYSYNWHDNNQTYTGTVTISQPATAITVTLTPTSPSCPGGSDGSALASVTAGGAAPFSYAWNPAGTNSPQKNGLSAGNVTVTVTDANGCTLTRTTVITAPTPMSASTTVINDSCFQSNKGSATVNTTGGTMPYTYYWSNISTAQTNLSLGAGTYTVTVTDNKGCTATSSATIVGGPSFTHTQTVQNISCYGNTTGSINIHAMGGTGTYVYTWNPNTVSGNNPTNLAAGFYRVTISDDYHCEMYDSALITQPATSFVATLSHTNVTCYGANNGTLTLNVSGGTPPYTYQGNPVPPGSTTLPNLAPGIYGGTISDAGGCTITKYDTITSPLVQSLNVTSTNNVCNGVNVGTATATFVNATGSVTYVWSNTTQTTQTITALAANTYNVTATDGNACSLTGTATVTEPPALTHTTSIQNANCNGALTGSVNIATSGGITPYTYTWNPNTVSGNYPTNLAAGTYYVTVTDANQCSFSETEIVGQPSALTGSLTHTNVTCYGANNGTLTVTVNGGTPPYMYQGNPVPPGSTTLTNLPPGNYGGALTDANGCSITRYDTITEPLPQSLTVTSTDNLCNGVNVGTATATFANPTGSVTYIWSNTTQTTQTITALAANTYNVTATDGNTCSLTGTATVNEPAALTHTISHTDVACNGGLTGSITVTPAGGVTPYSYAWNPNTLSGNNPTGLAAATYNVTVYDANQCSFTDAATIAEPTALTGSLSHTNVTCYGANNGTLTVTVNGGTPPYMYQGNPVPPGSTTLSNLPPGNYGGALTDANGCSITRYDTITEPLPQSLTVTATDVTCNGGNDGTATATYTNPTGSVTYVWSNTVQTTQTITAVMANTYAVTATDANSCSLTGSATVNQPAAPIMTVTVVDATCNGANGSATANPVGGGAFTYVWSSTAQTTQTIQIPAGNNYTVTATDASSCNQTAAYVVTEPTGMNIQEAHNNVKCNGGADGDIQLTVTGGVGPNYTYTWSPNVSTGNVAGSLTAGVYNIIITDQNSCTADTAITITEPAQPVTLNVQSTNVPCFGQNNGSITITATGGTGNNYTYTWSPNVSTTNSASNLSPNTYSVTVGDVNNCTVQTSVTISEPQFPLTLVTSSRNLTCNGSNDGSAAVYVSGGTFPYTYVWNPNVTTADSVGGLAANTYAVTVTDNNSCSSNASMVITEPAVLTAIETHVNVLCNGNATGAVHVTAAGGTPGYAYIWTNNVSTTDSANNLMAGTYNVTVTDTNACSATASAVVTEPAVLSVTATSTNVSCNPGPADGTITAVGAGGVTAYTFSATDGTNNYNSANGYFTALSAGTYTVNVTDQNSCSATTTATINQPTQLVPQVLPTDVSCYHYTNGVITATATGGALGYMYEFSTGLTNTTGILQGVPAGVYAVTITDANGCYVVDSAEVTEPDSVIIQVSPNPVEVKLGNTLQINTTTNQSGTVTYNWTPAFGLSCYDCPDPMFDGNYSQPYTVVATTADGCVGTSSLTVTVVPNYDIFFPNAFTPNGDGTNDYWQLFGNMAAVKQVDVKVFNRIGEMVFEGRDIDFKWDGTYKGVPVQNGVFVYIAKIVWTNNHSDNQFKGTITVIR